MRRKLKSVDIYFSGRSRRAIISVSLASLTLIALLDNLTGVEISFSIFYLLPILFVTWYAGKSPGLALSVCSMLLWLLADLTAGHQYSHPAIPLWNSLVRLMFFLTSTLMLSFIRQQLELESVLADTDPLTGLLNRRSFYEQCSSELERGVRYGHPLSLAYFDLDNFKQVNDSLGHEAGDELLRTVSDAIRDNVRKNDAVSRLGGDEFAVLFPMADYLTAEEAMRKVHRILDQEIKEHNWPVSFSIGLLTVHDGGGNLGDLLSEADRLMYSVKKRGKNALVHSVWPGKKAHA